jgi:hypothetical protein
VEALGRDEVAGAELFLANNGTGARLLLAQLAALPGDWLIDGSPRLRERPVGGLATTLRALGADIAPAGGGRSGVDALPLRVRGRALRGGTVALDPSASSQFVSALLLLAPRLPGGLEVELAAPPPSRPYIGLTLEVLRAFGASVETRGDDRWFRVAGPLVPGSYTVEGDWSAAAFPCAAVAVAGGEATVAGVRLASAQGDTLIARLLADAGCSVRETADGIAIAGPALRPVRADLRDSPDLFGARGRGLADRRTPDRPGWPRDQGERPAGGDGRVPAGARSAGARRGRQLRGRGRPAGRPRACRRARSGRRPPRRDGVGGRRDGRAGRARRDAGVRRQVVARLLAGLAGVPRGGAVRVPIATAAALARLLAWDASFLPVPVAWRRHGELVELDIDSGGAGLAAIARAPKGVRESVAIQLVAAAAFLFERGWYPARRLLRGARCEQGAGGATVRLGELPQWRLDDPALARRLRTRPQVAERLVAETLRPLLERLLPERSGAFARALAGPPRWQPGAALLDAVGGSGRARSARRFPASAAGALWARRLHVPRIGAWWLDEQDAAARIAAVAGFAASLEGRRLDASTGDLEEPEVARRLARAAASGADGLVLSTLPTPLARPLRSPAAKSRSGCSTPGRRAARARRPRGRERCGQACSRARCCRRGRQALHLDELSRPHAGARTARVDRCPPRVGLAARRTRRVDR